MVRISSKEGQSQTMEEEAYSRKLWCAGQTFWISRHWSQESWVSHDGAGTNQSVGESEHNMKRWNNSLPEITKTAAGKLPLRGQLVSLDSREGQNCGMWTRQEIFKIHNAMYRTNKCLSSCFSSTDACMEHDGYA